jgi:dolichyl-phosphate-mannose--protein O-mannosyl transferase
LAAARARSCLRAEPASRRGRRAATNHKWTGRDWTALSVVTGAAAIVRFYRLGHPYALVFDERYYVEEACRHLFGASVCAERIHSVAHPPLAKWLIASGMAALGHNPLGWRLAAAIAGSATVALLYVLGRRLLGSTWAAAFAAALLAVDSLHFIHSRLAMLDVFVTLFATAAVLCCIYDLDGGSQTEPATSRSRFLLRPWRALAGLTAGAAMASKGSGAFTLAALIAITLGATWSVGPANTKIGRLVRTARDQGLSLAALLIALPCTVYVLSHLGTVEGQWLVWPWDDGAWLRAFAQTQLASFGIHARLDVAHVYRSEPWFWFSSKPPLVYYYGWIGDSAYEMILGIGNPIAWWFAIPALFYVAARATRTPRVASVDAIIVLGFLFSYVPWLVLAARGRTTFLFYILPALPFMCLALARTASILARSGLGRVFVGLWIMALVGATVFAYPLVSAGRVELGSWRTAIGIARPDDRHNCDAPIHERAHPTDRPSKC